MFNMRDFIRKGLLDAVGHQPDYWVILNAAGWQQKGLLQDEDLAEINAAIEAKNVPPAEPLPEELIPHAEP